MLQVFHGGTMSDGRMAWAPGDGAWLAGGQLPGPVYEEREEVVRGKERLV